jgi:hypothetical protein
MALAPHAREDDDLRACRLGALLRLAARALRVGSRSNKSWRITAFDCHKR